MSNWESVLRSTVAGSMTGAVNGAFSELRMMFFENMTTAYSIRIKIEYSSWGLDLWPLRHAGSRGL